MNEEILKLKNACQKLGYAFFEDGDFNLNLIAVRENDVFENTFSDTLNIVYKENGLWKLEKYNWTTLAGTLGVGGEQNPLTASQTGTGVSGTAVIVEGQYRGAFRFVDSNNYNTLWLQYPYFDQIKNMNYYRDNDKNGIITRGRIYNGNYKTNLHRMTNNGVISRFVNYWNVGWSQGCNGCPEPDFKKIVALVRKSVALYGNIFSYTLLHRNQI